MLYALLKLVVRIAIMIFYKEVHIKLTSALPTRGPLIIVANHPNTFMDPIVIASFLKQEVYFLAKGTIFKNPVVGWLLGKMHMIPIYRKEDASDKSQDNNESFARCFEFLSAKGTLLIFPEGNSFNERRLRKIKTGTARIALGAEAQHGFNLGLQIVSIGLTYSNPRRFRSELFVSVDQPIAVADYAVSYYNNPSEAVNQLTEQIRKRLESHLIITSTNEEDTFVKNIERIYKNKLMDDLTLSPHPLEEDFIITRNIIEAVKYFEINQPEKLHAVKQKIDTYIRQLERLKLSDEILHMNLSGNKSSIFIISSLLYLFFFFPVYLYGLVNNYIPYIIPSRVARLITREEEYVAPVMMTTGIFSFTICYALQIAFFYQLTGSILWLTGLYALSLPVSGFLTWHYWNYITAFYDQWKLLSMFYRKQSLAATFRQKRLEILTALDEARNMYIANLEQKNTPTGKV